MSEIVNNTAQEQGTDSDVSQGDDTLRDGNAAQRGDGETLTGKPVDKEAEKQAAPPDPSAYALTMPEGFNDDHKAQFVDMAKEMGLTQEQTQKLIERSAKINADTQAAQVVARNEQVDAWNAALKADKDFGGTAFDSNVQYALAGLKHIDADGELTKMLDSSGYGSNPTVLKALARLGRDLNDDTIIGRGVTGNDAVLADRYFNK